MGKKFNNHKQGTKLRSANLWFAIKLTVASGSATPGACSSISLEWAIGAIDVVAGISLKLAVSRYIVASATACMRGDLSIR